MKSIQPRKQRKEYYNAPQHKKRKWLASHLDENLLLKYDKRAIPVIQGDTVKVMRGSFKGHEDKIAKVNIKKSYVEIEGIIMAKADGNKIAKPIHASNLVITKLNLIDKWRRNKLEKDLSEEAKKEIEKEGKEQIKEVEEEQKRLEVEAKALEEAEEEISDEEEEIQEETAKGEPKEEKPTKKPAAKKETTPKKKTETKKSTTKKPATKKETKTKKTPTKTTKAKEGKNK